MNNFHPLGFAHIGVDQERLCDEVFHAHTRVQASCRILEDHLDILS